MGSPAKIGPCGGIGGGDRDVDMSGVNRVVTITINHGAAIDSISFVYERNGLEETTGMWGGDGGSRSEIRLGRDEYLTSVTGHIGKFDDFTCVRSLRFISNLRNFGPFGREQGVPFQLPAVSANGKIVGFHARSGGYLDSIGTYVKMD